MRFRLGSDDWAKLQLSPDGRHLLGHWRDGQSMRRVLDGHELPPIVWRKGQRPEAFHAEALNRVGWLERSPVGVSVVMTNLECVQRLGPFEDVELGADGFSSDGLHVAFAFARGKRWWVWCDGEELGPYDEIERVGLIGATLVLQARQGRESVLRVGRHEHVGQMSASWPKIARDGGYGFGFKRGAQHFIQLATEVLGPFPASPRFALGTAGQVALEQELNGQKRVELNGRIVAEFVGQVVSLASSFSPNGQRFGFAYQEGSYAGVYLDGERRGQLGYADGPWWSADSAHAAFCADDDRGLLLVDGQDTELGSRVDFEEGSSFRFAPDGRFCVVLRDDGSGEQLLRMGAEQFGPFTLQASARRSVHEKLAFSADGAHFAFKYSSSRGLCSVRCDQRQLGPFDARSEFTLTPDGSLCLALFDPSTLEARLERSSPPRGSIPWES